MQVLCEAMAEPGRAVEEAHRKAYAKLFTCVERWEHVLSARQREHLACWKLWVILRLQLFTDDSFIFTKVARNIQELVKNLPDVSGEAEEEAAELLQVICFTFPCRVLNCTWHLAILSRCCC